MAACSFATAQPAGEADVAALVEQGKVEQALPLLEAILARSPHDLKARNLLGMAFSRMGRYEAAYEQFRKAIEIDGRSAPSLRNLAFCELALGRDKDAASHFDSILKSAPKDPAGHLGMAEVSFRQGHYGEAASHFEQSGSLYLKSPDYTLHYAQSCVELGRPAPAAEALKRMPADADAHLHFEAGLLLARLEMFEAAAQHFRLAQDGMADPYDPGYNLMLASIKVKQPRPAIEVGERLLARGYRKAELYNLLSQAYEQDGRTKEAYRALRTATEIDPADEGNYLDLMALCLDHQNWDLSLEIAGIALAKIPQSYRLHLERGAVLAMRTQYDGAEQEFHAAAKAAPQIALPYVSMALVQMQMNRLSEAIALLRERRKATPKDYLVNWFLAEALNRDGVSPGTPAEEEAISALRQAVESNPKGEQARLLLGKFLFKHGDTDQAIEQLTRALELDPEDSSATYQLAQAYRKKGDGKRAAELFAKVSKEKAEAREQFTQRNLVRIIREGVQ